MMSPAPCRQKATCFSTGSSACQDAMLNSSEANHANPAPKKFTERSAKSSLLEYGRLGGSYHCSVLAQGSPSRSRGWVLHRKGPSFLGEDPAWAGFSLMSAVTAAMVQSDRVVMR